MSQWKCLINLNSLFYFIGFLNSELFSLFNGVDIKTLGITDHL